MILNRAKKHKRKVLTAKKAPEIFKEENQSNTKIISDKSRMLLSNFGKELNFSGWNNEDQNDN